MLNLPITVINQNEPFDEIHLDKAYWGISRNTFSDLLPNMLSELTPEEVHLHSNGFGRAKYKFTARILGQIMCVYALFGGKDENKMITLSMGSDTQNGNDAIRVALMGLFGEPTDRDHVLYTSTWKTLHSDLNLDFRDFTTSFTISLKPFDLFQFDNER